MNIIFITICSLVILLGFEIRYRQLKIQMDELQNKIRELNDFAVFTKTPERHQTKER